MTLATPTLRIASPAALGLALTLCSAFFFSALGVVTQLAYEAGAPVGTLLTGRFLIAALILWPLVWVARFRRPARRQIVAGLLLGVGYGAHAWLFSEALARLDAGLVDLLLFTYPALVMLGAVMLRRDRWSRPRAIALVTATAGTALVLVGGLGSIDPLGAALAIGAAVAYSAYILSSAGQLERTDPLVLTALVTTGAGVALAARGVGVSDVSLDIGASALALIALVGLVAVAGMSTFIAGIGRLGPSRASIVSAVQPALTPVLGFAVFADRLGPTQLLGAMFVVAGVVILESRDGSSPAYGAIARLPRSERRTLARAAMAIDVPAGASVLHQGAPADSFFVIERGRARVTRDARPIADLGPGEFFGEIALLRGGTRTASVVAATDMRVKVVRRREFTRAVTALPTLAHVVRTVTQERLLALPTQLAPAR